MSDRAATLISVADDLDSVTTTGPEDDPATAGVDPAAVAAIWDSVRDWYRLGSTPAIQICLRRNGRIVLNRAIGHARGNAPGDGPDTPRVPLTPDMPFCGFSTAKGVAAATIVMLAEQGAFRVEDPVSRYVPEFGAHDKQDITIADVLSHSAGVPFVTKPYRGTELVLDEELAVRGLADLEPSWPRNRFRVYHALTGGLILRLLVQRATGRSMRAQLSENILRPLGFRWTNFGIDESDIDAVVPSVRVGPGPNKAFAFVARKALGGGMGGGRAETTRAFYTAELPSGNLITTAAELSRFYEILGRGGELDGVRVMSPETVRRAVAPAPWLPGVAGKVSRAGFELGGRRSKFGRDTGAHFGRSGLTTQYGWADADRGLSGAVLTSGKSTIDGKRPWQLVARISGLVDRLHPADRPFVL